MASIIIRHRQLLSPPLQCLSYLSSKTNKSNIKRDLHRIPLCYNLSKYEGRELAHYKFSTAASEEAASASASSSSSSSSSTNTNNETKKNPKEGHTTLHHQSSSSSSSSSSNKKILKISDVPISEVLKAKHTIRWVEPVICQSASISEAILVCIERGLSGMMVVDRGEQTSESSREKGKVVGLVSSRDLLRIMAAGIRSKDKSSEEILAQRVSEFMTPISQVIYARPDETIRQCRTIMAKLGVKCLPILSNGRVEGLLTQRDMSDFGLDARDRGGKKNYLKDVSTRVGLSSDTSMAEPPTYVYKEQMPGSEAFATPLICNVGLYELPHPFKTPEKCGITKRDHGPLEFGKDVDLSEDAHFYLNACSHTAYFGVADGVGSWREYGIDPREFSHALMVESENVINEILKSNSKTCENSEDIINKVSSVDVLDKAYQRVKDSNIVGSSTACIAVFDGKRHQLHFSNVGDSGVIILRHIDSHVAGALKRDRTKPRLERTSDLRIAFVSQQQLRSFNHPYQLGFTGITTNSNTDEESSSFKSPLDSCTSSIHVRKDDIILVATDGLFDNVDMDEIVSVVLAWETKQKKLKKKDKNNKNIQELAKELAWLARERSLDDSVDSPFAILAKENDIMWSGGMPDDCTVIALHVVGRNASTLNV